MNKAMAVGLCLVLSACAQEVTKRQSSAEFYPVEVGASPQFLQNGVSASLAEAMDWGQQAPLLRGGQEVLTANGTFALQRLRYDDYDLALVEVMGTGTALLVGADITGPLEGATNCKIGASDHKYARLLSGRMVFPLEC